MRVVIYTKHMVPLNVIDLEGWEIEVLREVQVLELTVPAGMGFALGQHPGGEVGVQLRYAYFRLADGQPIHFLVIKGEDEGEASEAMLATDTNMAFPDGSQTVARFRKEFTYRLAVALRELAGFDADDSEEGGQLECNL